MRYWQLEHIARIIKERKLTGSVAEVGVFRGDFSRYINIAFKESTYYLFDTFGGFSSEQLEKDIQQFNVEKNKKDTFKDTSIDIVINKLVYSEKCIIKKGVFPDTAEGIDDNFIFVMLDADLYDPIYAGLNFFYDRLVDGGYIIVHDYFNLKFSGAKAAVDTFCKERKVPFVPSPDAAGSAVIAKA